MKQGAYCLLTWLVLSSAAWSQASTVRNVCFSPPASTQQLSCEAMLVQAIEQAQQFVVLYMYSLTAAAVIDALATASAHRQLPVLVLLDEHHHKTSRQAKAALDQLVKHGVSVTLMPGRVGPKGGRYGIFHHKLLIACSMDQQSHCLIVTGSYNMTQGARDKNAEHLVFIEDHGTLAQQMIDYFADVLPPYEELMQLSKLASAA